MDGKSSNLFYSLTRSYDNLRISQGADATDFFVIPATAFNFCMTFDLSWRVMEDLLSSEFHVTDFAKGNSKDALKAAYKAELISDDRWMDMQNVRAMLSHDYDGSVSISSYDAILSEYLELIGDFIIFVSPYYEASES